MRTMAIAGVLLVGLAVAPARAEEGQLNAVSYASVPAGQAVAVRPLDNSDANLRLKALFEEALRAQGYGVAADAQMVMTFDVQATGGDFVDAGRRTWLELRASGEGAAGNDQSVTLNLFDSTAGALLNQGTSPGTSVITPTQYRIDLTLDPRGRGQRVWQAWAVADLGQRDAEALTRAMVRPMVGAIGSTVRQQPFALPD